MYGSRVNIVLSTGLAAFLATAVFRPLINRYQAWKRDPARERVYRQDLFGRFVPDLWITRVERSLLVALIGVFIFGLAVDWTIMHEREPHYTDKGDFIVPIKPPQ